MKEDNTPKLTGFLDDILGFTRKIAFGAGLTVAGLAGLYTSTAMAEDRPREPVAEEQVVDADADRVRKCWNGADRAIYAIGNKRQSAGGFRRFITPVAQDGGTYESPARHQAQKAAQSSKVVRPEDNPEEVIKLFRMMNKFDVLDEGLEFRQSGEGMAGTGLAQWLNGIFGSWTPENDETMREYVSFMYDWKSNGAVQLDPSKIVFKDNATNPGMLDDVLYPADSCKMVKRKKGKVLSCNYESVAADAAAVGWHISRVNPRNGEPFLRGTDLKRKKNAKGVTLGHLLVHQYSGRKVADKSRDFEEQPLSQSLVMDQCGVGFQPSDVGVNDVGTEEVEARDIKKLFEVPEQKYSVDLRPVTVDKKGERVLGEAAGRDDAGNWHVSPGTYTLEQTELKGLDNVSGNLFVVNSSKFNLDTEDLGTLVSRINGSGDRAAELNALVSEGILMEPKEAEGENDIGVDFEIFDDDRVFLTYFEGKGGVKPIERSEAIIKSQKANLVDGKYTKKRHLHKVEDAGATRFVVTRDAENNVGALCEIRGTKKLRYFITHVPDGDGWKPFDPEGKMAAKAKICRVQKGHMQAMPLSDFLSSDAAKHTKLAESLPEEVRNSVPKDNIGRLVLGFVEKEAKEAPMKFSRPFITPTAAKDSAVGGTLDVTYQPGEAITRGTNGGVTRTEFHNLTLDGLFRLNLDKLTDGKSPVAFVDLNTIYRLSNGQLNVDGSKGSKEGHSLWLGLYAGFGDGETWEAKLGPRIMVYNQENMTLTLPTGGQITADARNAFGWGLQAGGKLRVGDWTAELNAEYLNKAFSEYVQIPGMTIEPKTDKNSSELNLEGLVRLDLGSGVLSGLQAGVNYTALLNAMSFRDQNGEQNTQTEQHSVIFTAGPEMQLQNGNHSVVVSGAWDPAQARIGGKLDVHLMGEYMNASAIILVPYDGADSKPMMIFGISGSK